MELSSVDAFFRGRKKEDEFFDENVEKHDDKVNGQLVDHNGD